MNRQTVDRNLRFLVLELFWASIHIASLSFNSAFLIRLGGSNTQVSWLAAVPALVIALTTMPFALRMERTRRLHRWVVGSLFASRLSYVLLIFVPYFPTTQAAVIITTVLIANIGASLFSAGWLPMLGDMIPIERRARVFATRNLVLGITVALTTFLLGRWFEFAPFPFNYQAVYVLSLVTSLISTWYVARMVVPERDGDVPLSNPRMSVSGLRSSVQSQRPFANIVLNTLIFTIPAWMAVPLQPIYFVRELNADEGWLGLWTALVSVGAVFGNIFWQRVIDRKGMSWVLIRATLLSAAYYVLIAIFPNLNLILVFGLFVGMVTPGIELSHINTLYAVVPTERRATYLGVYTAVMNTGAFVAPLIVAPLLGWFDARLVLLGMCLVRFVGAALFAVNPVHTVSAEQLAPSKG